MNTEEMMKENNRNEFLQKLEILTLALSLKENNQRVASPEFYSSLYSTYIKMLENDDDQYFIDKENQSNVIDSLKRSMDFYASDHPSFLQKTIEKMTNNDPTDFMIFQNLNHLDKAGSILPHYCGWIIYKREHDLFVVQVDRREQFGVGQVSYARIPITKIACLSELFFLKLNLLNPNEFSLFHGIKSISAGFQEITVLNNIEKQGIDNPVSALEDILKVLLFHYTTDLFSLNTTEMGKSLWHGANIQLTIQIRESLLAAIKTDNHIWNEQFDYIFDYYLYQSENIGINAILPRNKQSDWRNSIKKSFNSDPYIHALMSSNGKISGIDEEALQKNLVLTVKPVHVLYDRELALVSSTELMNTLYHDGMLITIYEDRLPMIKKPIAKEMNQRFLLRLQERYQEINKEMKRRIIKNQLEELTLKSNSYSVVQLGTNAVSTSDSSFFQTETMKQQKKHVFSRNIDMLALTLSLKSNDDINCFPRIYDLLFSTYIKMIKNDQEAFFIDRQRQPNIIQSLQRTLEIYKLTNLEDLHNIFGNLRNNDPTDFVLFPAYFHMLDPKEGGHICGLTIYKRDNELIIMQVDKESFYESGAVSYVKAPLKNIQELSQIIFSAREFFDFKPYGILRKIEAISHKFKAIPAIKLAHQTTGNCGIIEIEATLRLILFHCKKDIFALQTCDRITPKWGGDDQGSATIEMKVRFVEAMKGTNQEWNQNFDYLLGHYIYRKKQSMQWGEAQLSVHKDYWYTSIRHLYSNDLYILEILNSGGMIPAVFDLSLKEKMIEIVGKVGIVLNGEIKAVGLSDLYKEFRENNYELELLKGRLSFLKIPVAKEMLDYYIARIKAKNIEIKKEISRRIGIEPKESSCQMMDRLPIVSPIASVQSPQLSSATSQRTTETMVPVPNRFTSMIDQVKQISEAKNQHLVSKRVKCKVQNTLTK
ncbi:hypothetical protein C6P52_09485 [Enterococcus mundtii]|nr:hypothetical protein C6P52_09485 [Enterococcus mundtii]PTO43519.1 hypothetical protein C6P54_09710 [Enterococcus mundtii]